MASRSGGRKSQVELKMTRNYPSAATFFSFPQYTGSNFWQTISFHAIWWNWIRQSFPIVNGCRTGGITLKFSHFIHKNCRRNAKSKKVHCWLLSLLYSYLVNDLVAPEPMKDTCRRISGTSKCHTKTFDFIRDYHNNDYGWAGFQKSDSQKRDSNYWNLRFVIIINQ